MHPTSGKDTNSSYSPSFNSYFNTDLAQIAARVTTEFPDADDFAVTDGAEDEFKSDNGAGDAEVDCEDDADDFEFDLSNLMPDDGEIRPVYPVFNRDLLGDLDLEGEIETRPSDPGEEDSSRAQIQLKSLFLEDRDRSGADLDPPSSSSSSEAGDLEEILPGTYCVWAPNKSPATSPSPGRCTKSNSTGSSVTLTGKAKAWKLTDFLKRSKSDGKEGLMLLTPKKKVEASVVRGTNNVRAAASSAGNGGKPVRVKPARTAAAREGYYGGARSKQGGENKRKSYLPYRQDLVGLFASPQAFRKMHLPPF